MNRVEIWNKDGNYCIETICNPIFEDMTDGVTKISGSGPEGGEKVRIIWIRKHEWLLVRKESSW